MNRTLLLTITVVSAAAIGIGSFWAARALADGDAAADPWVVPLSQPSVDLDLDLDPNAHADPDASPDPVAEVEHALDTAAEETGIDLGATGSPAGQEPEAPTAAEVREALDLPTDRELPDDAWPWTPETSATNIDLAARGLTAPEAAPGTALHEPTAAPDSPEVDGIWDGVDPALPFIALELADDDPDDDDSVGALDDPEELDVLLFRHWGVDWPGFSFLDDEPVVLVDRDDDPDFLDACAATIDDVPLDCGDGMGGTVLPLMPPLDLITIAIDAGPRCDGMLEGDGIPVRLTFNRPFAAGAQLNWQGTSAGAAHTRITNIEPHPVGLAAYTDADPEAAVFHHCVALPADATSSTYELRVRAFADHTRLDHTVLLTTPPTWSDGRPPTTLEQLGDRRMLVHAPARTGGAVSAHLVVREETDHTVHCDPELLPRERTDWGRWPGRGEPVRIRPAQRTRILPSEPYDPAYDRTITYDLSFRPTDAHGQLPTFVLCLTWEQIENDGRVVVAGESHLIAPPQRPTVDVYVESDGWLTVPNGTGGAPDRTGARVEIRQTAEASNGTTSSENRHVIGDRPDGGSCDRSLLDEEITRPGLERMHVCRFELTEERREVLLGLNVRSSGRDGYQEFDHARLVRLPGHPEHALRRAGCPTGCAEVHTAHGWVTEQRFRSNGAPDVGVPVTFVVTSDPHDQWFTASAPSRIEPPERPILDTRATTVSLIEDDPRGIELNYLADRPVAVRWFARPAGIGSGWAEESGCADRSFPHEGLTAVRYRQQDRVVIRDACALTSYRFALELTDEDGNRAVYGDLLTWVAATRDSGAGLALDDAFVADGWNPRLRTRGHDWLIDTDVTARVVDAGQKLPAGVHVGNLPTGATRMRGLDWEHMVDIARDTLLQSLQVRVGGTTITHGETAGDGKRCMDPRSEHGPRSRNLEVGDTVTFSADGHFEHHFHGCPGNLFGRSGVFQSFPVRLPRDERGRPTVTVPTDLLEEAGRVILVLHSGPLVPAWHDRADDFVLETVVTIQISPDTPRPTTLRGER